jgi:hypothetical protein
MEGFFKAKAKEANEVDAERDDANGAKGGGLLTRAGTINK